MAFDPDRLSLLVQPVGDGGMRWFNYQTDEVEETILGDGYFQRGRTHGLRLADLIFVSPKAGTEEPYILTVEDIDDNGNATAVNSSRSNTDVPRYRDKAAVADVKVPASVDNIIIDAYSASANPSSGRANYKAATLAEYNAVPAALRLTDANGRRFIINEKRLSPDMAGGDPTGTTDSSAAFNAIFTFIRTDIATNPDGFTKYVVDMAGGKYRVTSSINATNVVGWNVVLTNGIIIGACTGKAVLDITGSRGMTLSNFSIYGEKANMPAAGIMAARNTTGARACDMMTYEDLSVTGFYSIAADYSYAQESTHRRHCKFWNYNPNGYAGIYQGYNTHALSSDFVTVLTGGNSFIHNQFDNCDWRYLPIDGIFSISGITKGATTTVTMPGPGHTFTVGQTVVFWLVGGMTQISSTSATILSTTSTTIVVDIDSTGFSNFTSGGFIVVKQTVPTIFWSRGSQHRFNCCYVVSYGDDAIYVDFPDTFNPEELTFDFLNEGVSLRSFVRFGLGSSARTLTGFDVKTYVTMAKQGLFSASATTGNLSIKGGNIRATSHYINTSLPLVVSGQEGLFGFDTGTRIVYPNTAGLVPASYLRSNAWYSSKDTNRTFYGGSKNGTWTPTVTSSIGTITSYTAAGTLRQITDQLVFVSATITITTNGTANGAVAVTLPTGLTGVSGYQQMLAGRAAVGGKMLIATVNGAASSFGVANYDNTSALGSDGQILQFSGVMEVAPI